VLARDGVDHDLLGRGHRVPHRLVDEHPGDEETAAASPACGRVAAVNTANTPAPVGIRYVHTPGWQQQFLITWMLINKTVWNAMTRPSRS